MNPSSLKRWQTSPMRRFLMLLGAASALSLLASCGKTNIAWKEEVALSSGEVITVQRTAKTKAFGELGGSGGWENEGMSVKVIASKLKDPPPEWNFPFVPMVFDQDSKTGQWFMVATFYSCTSWYDLGRPKLPYVEYHLQSGKWVQQASLSAQHIGRIPNMFGNIASSGVPDQTIMSKSTDLSNPMIAPKYRSILGKWSTTC